MLVSPLEPPGFSYGEAQAGLASDVETAKILCVEAFRDWLEKGEKSDWSFPDGVALREKILDNIEDLRGKDVACFCKEGEACHGDVYLDVANCSGPQ